MKRVYFFVLLGFLAQPLRGVESRIVAVVSDRPILSSQVQTRLRMAVAGQKLPDSVKQRLVSQIVKVLVDESIQQSIMQEAEKQGFSPHLRDEDYEQGWVLMAQSHSLSVKDLQRNFRKNGVPFSYVKTFLEHEITWSRYIEWAFYDRARPTKQEIALCQNQKAYKGGRVKLAELALYVNKKSEEQSVLSRIQSIKELLNQGMPFHQAAFQFSQGTQRIRGGDHGWIFWDDLDLLAIKQALQQAKNHCVVGPLRTRWGWSLFWITERDDMGGPLTQKEAEHLVFQEKLSLLVTNERLQWAQKIFHKILVAT